MIDIVYITYMYHTEKIIEVITDFIIAGSLAAGLIWFIKSQVNLSCCHELETP